MTLETTATAIKKARLRPRKQEVELQDALALTLAPLGFIREFRADAQNRPDFAHPVSMVFVEVKTGGSAAELDRQILRYVLETACTAVIVVTTRANHNPPTTMRRRGEIIPIITIRLSGL